MKTALQELIEKLEKHRDGATSESTRILLSAIVMTCKDYLPAEQKQLDDAYTAGMNAVDHPEPTYGNRNIHPH